VAMREVKWKKSPAEHEDCRREISSDGYSTYSGLECVCTFSVTSVTECSRFANWYLMSAITGESYVLYH